MFRFIRLCLGMLVRFFRVRQSLLLENLALRQQLAVLKRRRRSPCLSPFDKLFWVAVSRFWSGWKQALIVVTPETVIRWLSFAKTPHEAILIRVTCYTASLYVIDFTCALNFGEAQPHSS